MCVVGHGYGVLGGAGVEVVDGMLAGQSQEMLAACARRHTDHIAVLFRCSW